MLPVPADEKVSMPALSECPDAGAPSPVIWNGMFGCRSEMYCVVAPEAGDVTLVNVGGQSRMNINTAGPPRAPSKLCPPGDSPTAVSVLCMEELPHSRTERNWTAVGLPALTLIFAAGS